MVNSFMARFWYTLIEPSVAIQEPMHRRRARMLSGLLIILLLLCLIAILLTVLNIAPAPTQTQQQQYIWVLFGALVLLAVGYALSRSRYYELAAGLTIISVLFATSVSFIIDPSFQVLIAFLVMGGILSGLFLSPRATALTFISTLLVVFAIHFFVQNYSPTTQENAGFLIFAVGIIVVVGTVLRQQDMEQLEAQTHILAERGTQLEAAMKTVQDTNVKLRSWVEQLEQRTAEITLLSQMGDMLQTCQMASEAYTVFGQFADKLFPETSGAVYLIKESANYVGPVVVWGAASVQLTKNVFRLNDCWALRSGRIHMRRDQTSELVCPHIEKNQRTAFPYICIPMMAQGETLGVFHMEADGASMQLNDARQQLAQTVSEHLSLALANLRLRETLQHQSIRDPLTGLFNRRYLEETFERELQRVARSQGSLGILMFDIDHFKKFNDVLGHEAGDVLLRELGNILRAHVRGADIVCRYGGEEFTLILPDATLEVTQHRAEELRQLIAALRVAFRGQPLGPVTISIGVAAFPIHGADKEVLLRVVDAALYRAKQEGRNRVVTALT